MGDAAAAAVESLPPVVFARRAWRRVLAVGLHGLFAVRTVVLALLAALELSRRDWRPAA